MRIPAIGHTHTTHITYHYSRATTYNTNQSFEEAGCLQRKKAKKKGIPWISFLPGPPRVCVTRRTWDVDTDRGRGGVTLLEAQQRKLMHMWPWMTLGSREGPDRRRREIPILRHGPSYRNIAEGDGQHALSSQSSAIRTGILTPPPLNDSSRQTR